jgi:Spy/CpxP family protein refolding chaperone
VYHRRSYWHWRFHPVFAHGCGSTAASAQWADEAARRAQRFAHRRFEEEEPFGGAGLGVRRPLRFLAWKLDLGDEQTARLARVLERLKLERAQASLDLRRAAADLADALESAEFARAKVDAASELRNTAARRVQEAVARALEELHALLEPDQRARLAELLRTGAIRI